MNLRKAVINTAVVIIGTAPPMLFSYYYGPDAGYSGAPGDNSTGCIASGCHVGTVNSGPGSITITASGGTTYTPGQAQTITVTVADSTKQKFGFQLSARVDSNPKVQGAGTFTVGSDGYTQIVTCSSSAGAAYTGSCPTGNTLQWIEQTDAGFLASAAGSFTFTFTWTPPATNVGTVTLYAAGNAGTGSTSTPVGTNAYLTSLQLSPSTTITSSPTISAGGINAIYSSSSLISSGSWVSIYGSNLASTTTQWTGNYPTTLGGTSVTVDGNAAYLSYVSPSLVNLQVPTDSNLGTVNVTVTTANGSVSSSATMATYSPSFSLLDSKHVAGIILRTDGSGAYGSGTYDIIGPTGTSLGYSTVAAKAGDSVVLFGVGFGPTNPQVTAGQTYSGAAQITGTLQMTINSTSVTPSFAGMSGNGLYQFNLTIPSGLGTGDVPLSATIVGSQTQSNVVISLQ